MAIRPYAWLPWNRTFSLWKPYTITKSRESCIKQKQYQFLKALQLFDRDWKKIEAFVGSKIVIQIRSHAQKYFLKVQKSGTSEHVLPHRPKRKAVHLYPQKIPKMLMLCPKLLDHFNLHVLCLNLVICADKIHHQCLEIQLPLQLSTSFLISLFQPTPPSHSPPPSMATVGHMQCSCLVAITINYSIVLLHVKSVTSFQSCRFQ